jgi:cAMP-dependent protein kinase regulator
VLELPLEVLSDLIKDDPNILKIVLRVFGERLIENALRKAPLFAELAPDDRKSLGARFKPTAVRKGTVLVQQGAAAAGLFLVIQGELEVTRGAEHIAELGPGALFGEISVLTGLPATATVTAVRKCLLLTLPAAEFQTVASAHPQLLEHAARVASERMPDA